MSKQFLLVTVYFIIMALFPREMNAVQFYGDEDSAPTLTREQPHEEEETPVTFDSKMWGNSFLWEHETDDGYTIIQDDDGYYYLGSGRVENPARQMRTCTTPIRHLYCSYLAV